MRVPSWLVLPLFGVTLMFLAGAGSFAQNPGSGPNVGALGNFGPPFTFQNGHLVFGPTAGPPTVNSGCGTGATVIGTDSAFLFTSGTSTSTACAITPRVAWGQRPICSLDAQAATQPAWSISGNGTIALTGVADSTLYNVTCIGQPGG